MHRLQILIGWAWIAMLIGSGLPLTAVAQDSLRERLEDENGVRTDVWVYNDIEAARAQALRENKPLFVTFRCVPCKACQSFDAEVANGSDLVRQLAEEQFVSVRQVEMKDVDLSLFQFDHDLNWAAMFIHPDGTVYARYGTQSSEGPDAYNSIPGLLNTMRRVVELHQDYPNNREQLVGKRGNRQIDSALNLPGLENPARYKAQTTRRNCIHCHNIHDAENRIAQQANPGSFDFLYRYPLPDQLGLSIDRTDGVTIRKVRTESPADRAGLQADDQVTRINGQAIVSIADMQWVLHHLPPGATSLTITTGGGDHAVRLEEDWKTYDASWRGSMWSVSPRLKVFLPVLPEEQRQKLGIDASQGALKVQFINRKSPAGKSALAAGLKEGDVVVELDGEPLETGIDNRQFNYHIKLNYRVGDTLPLTVLRNGARRVISIKLVE